MKRGLVFLAAVTTLASLPVVAQALPGSPIKIGFGGGFSVPVSNAQDAFHSGFHGKASVMWSPPVLPFGIRGSLGYERLDLKGLAPGIEGAGQILSGVGDLCYGFPLGPLKPYLIAGVGAYNMKATVNGTSSPSETKFGIDAGAGLEFKLGGITGFVEGKLENIFTDQGFGAGEPFDTRVVPVTFGIFY